MFAAAKGQEWPKASRAISLSMVLSFPVVIASILSVENRPKMVGLFSGPMSKRPGLQIS